MSLQLAAQHLAAKGRGPDSMLIHMAPREVESLQALARAHGGTLTVNPDTGLPEAGFLSSILPTIAGIGLTALSGGTLSPLMAGLLVGGGTGLVTGDLRKGLAAGLGAYGGAGIGSALAGAGANAAASELAAANQGLAAQLGPGANAKDILLARGAAAPGAAMQSLQSSPIMSGIKAVADKPSLLFNKDNLKYASAALAPVTMQPEMNARPMSMNSPAVDRYSYNPGLMQNPQRAGGVGEYNFFNPVYTRMAEGGPVQSMSDRNDTEMLMANGGQRFADGGNVAVPKYIFDPVTNTYKDVTTVQPVSTVTKMPGYVTKDVTRDVGTNSPEEVAAQGAWGNLSPLQQAEYYASHPVQAAITQTGQNAFGFTSLGALQNAMVPDFVSLQHSIPDMTGAGLLAQVQNTENFHDAMMGVPITIANYGATGPNVGGWGSNVNVGQQVTPSAQSLSLSGGLIPALIGKQNPAPVEDAVPTISNEQAALQAAAEYNAALEAAATSAASGFGSQGETAPGGIGFGSDIGFDSGPVGGVDGGGGGGADGGAGAGADGGGGAVGDGDGGGGPGSAGWARGGILAGAFSRGGYHLGDYSDGGRLLRGPGDGVSDDIPATIAGKRPARLADGEFVVPARIVSELGNGSTEAGARKLYAMMDRVQKNRKKTVGKGKVAVNSRSDKYLPA